MTVRRFQVSMQSPKGPCIKDFYLEEVTDVATILKEQFPEVEILWIMIYPQNR